MSTIVYDLRDEFISRVVCGKTFADVGGLWGIVNEKVSVAARSHAAALAMIDMEPVGGDLWQQFRKRLETFGVEGCECISSDVCSFASAVSAPQYDVVHCSGVLYHHPDPISLLASLRRLTRHHLILTSAVTQEHVSNDLGSYNVAPSGAIFVPALDQRERDVLWKYWRDVAGVEACFGISEPAQWDLKDFAPWWWLPTVHTMLALTHCAGFELIESGPIWNGNAHTALMQVSA